MDQVAINPLNSSPNYWKISTLTLAGIMLTLAIFYIWILLKSDSVNPSSIISPPKVTLVGTVTTGEQLGEVKSYCPNGLYLMADEGSYLINEISLLQLRIFQEDASVWNDTAMLTDRQYVDKRVRVSGKYPTQEAFCMAAMCACDDFILVDEIEKY